MHAFTPNAEQQPIGSEESLTMKYLFAINHPAHYHLFKNSYHNLKAKGHDVVFAVKDKDILEKLMVAENVTFHRLTRKRVGHSSFAILTKGVLELLIQDISLFRFARKYHPDLMIGTDMCITHIGKILRKPSIVFNEDDYELNRAFCSLSYPFCNWIVSPRLCRVGKYVQKKITYDGYQKLAYLHPDVFKPDPDIVRKYIDPGQKYFLVRLVSFSAGHDINLGGLNEAVLEELLNILSGHGKVFLTNESKISERLEKFRLQIDVKDMHHIMASASLFISDGQSMIVEAAILGVPSIRFNSLDGKVSILEELENRFNLTVKIHNSRPDLLMEKINELLGTENLAEVFQKRREQMLKEKINVTSFMTWLFENYPESVRSYEKYPEIQGNFR